MRRWLVPLAALALLGIPALAQTLDLSILATLNRLGIDLLLGMSFLSHFKVSIDTQAVRISSQKTK